MARKKHHKIEWKRLLSKALEDGIKKAIELILIALIVGASIKLILVAVPAVTLGAVIAKLAKLRLMG
ncbi:hypothetical protein KY331_05485 [Candidatus Woesearchaeota archaeon]|nr:hypothetical protein [Candidatus Woesearchaeota archaeon]